MQKFIGVKLVNAEPMSLGDYNILRGWKIPENQDPEEKGYLVEYVGTGNPNHPDYENYISWSPEDTFDDSHREITNISFGFALEAARIGKRIQRIGWNGKGLWIDYVKGESGRSIRAITLDKEETNAYLPETLPYLRLNYPSPSEAYPNGATVPWLPSSTDVLADDWIILED